MFSEIEEGYLYIARGEKYINEALQSIKSLKKHKGNVHVSLITDKHVSLSEFDSIIIVECNNSNGDNDWKDGLLYKVKSLLKSPYKRTFFIDTDTYFCDDCNELFQLLEYYDLLIAHAPQDRSMVMVNNCQIQGYHPYNTGVMVFNNKPNIKELFEEWLRIYQEKFDIYNHDQTPLMEALLTKKTNVYVLQPIYNFRLPSMVTIPGLKVKILHGRSSNFPKLDEEINGRIKHRTWLPGFGGVIYGNISLRSLVKRKVLGWLRLN